jgi:hypothetical protein
MISTMPTTVIAAAIGGETRPRRRLRPPPTEQPSTGELDQAVRNSGNTQSRGASRSGGFCRPSGCRHERRLARLSLTRPHPWVVGVPA